MSDNINIILQNRKGVQMGQIQINPQTTDIKQLKTQIQKITKITPIRQWLTVGDGKVLDDNKRIIKTYQCVNNNTVIVVKDLGFQLSWSLVFYLEYLGPIFFYSLTYFIGTSKSSMSFNQNIGLLMGVAHFVKRLLETQFVHIFSRDSMPIASCWKNFVHYWFLFGLFIGTEYFNFHSNPNYSAKTNIILLTGWLVSEFFNLMCHIHLSSLRKNVTTDDGSSTNKCRQIPQGWGFNQVSCANYFWEICGWVFFSLFSRCYTSYLFTFFSFYQMFQWALQKQERYKKEFGKQFPRNRKAIIPFVI